LFFDRIDWTLRYLKSVLRGVSPFSKNNMSRFRSALAREQPRIGTSTHGAVPFNEDDGSSLTSEDDEVMKVPQRAMPFAFAAGHATEQVPSAVRRAFRGVETGGGLQR